MVLTPFVVFYLFFVDFPTICFLALMNLFMFYSSLLSFLDLDHFLVLRTIAARHLHPGLSVCEHGHWTIFTDVLHGG